MSEETPQENNPKVVDPILLTLEQATGLASMPLRCINQEFPNKLGQTLKDEILLERRLELCFEGQRLWDLMRKKEDIVRTQCTASICFIPYGDDTNILPIPQIETDVNSNIKQNPGY